MPNQHNPWLDIPAADYEAHMSADAVGQQQALNGIFRDCYGRLQPKRLLVLGCATGNGFEHIDPRVTAHVAAVDINPHYLVDVTMRFARTLSGLEISCRDLADDGLPDGVFDQVHCALIFEYLDPAPLLAGIAAQLAPAGTVTAVLQVPGDHANVSPTEYASLRRLEPVMRLVAPAEFLEMVHTAGLRCVKHAEHELPNGKRFAELWLEHV
ncbi:class I SAM-dependent methyltransferase [bacterium]|nr:class I SAM-dependent methyltransferase [bacterium]